jgi:hypothetical protein
MRITKGVYVELVVCRVVYRRRVQKRSAHDHKRDFLPSNVQSRGLADVGRWCG